MLIKGKGRPTYLLGKNAQIKLWDKQSEHMLNRLVVQALKLTDSIIIIINEGQEKDYHFFSNSENNSKRKNLEPNPTNNNNYSPTSMFNFLNQVINPNNINIQLCNFCIESKNIKIVRHKKMISTT